jgi:hypothetical protein
VNAGERIDSSRIRGAGIPEISRPGEVQSVEFLYDKTADTLSLPFSARFDESIK